MGLLTLRRGFKSPLLWVLVSVAGVALSPLAVARAQDIELEYQVKSAFVFNFARFVKWPAAAFAAPDSPIVIGVVGHDAFIDALQNTIPGKTVEGRTVVVKPYEGAGTPVHLLVISKYETKRAAELVKQLRGQPVLTISESSKFLRMGGMIRLSVQEDKVRFAVNLPAVSEAGLNVSSQMLQYAQVVR